MRRLALSLAPLLFVAVQASAATPYQVADLRTIPPYGVSSNPIFLASFGDVALFLTNPGAQSSSPQTTAQLWRTDGTPGGTYRLITLTGDPRQTLVYGLINTGSALVFSAPDSEGWKVWQTDGTMAGTSALTPASPGILVPAGFTDGKLFLIKSGSREIWLLDSAGLRRLYAYQASEGWTAAATWGGNFYFGTNAGIWKSNGTESGTNRIFPGAGFAFRALGNRLYFVGFDSATGYELWSTDGSEGGTHIVSDFHAGTASTFALSSSLVTLGDRLLFTGANAELGTSDGTSAGTRLIRDGKVTTRPVVLGGAAYFGFNDGNGTELWRSDGTEAGTKMVRDTSPDANSSISAITAAATRLYYFGTDADRTTQLFTSDGTENGTRAIPPTRGPRWHSGAYPLTLATLGDRAVFAADDGPYGSEPWITDGTDEGSRMLANIAVEEAPSSGPGAALAGTDRIFFLATGDDGQHLYVSDGTAAGTRAVGDPPKEQYPEMPVPAAVAGDTVYLKKRSQLWKATSAPQSMTLVRDFKQGYNIPQVVDVTVFGNRVFLRADDGDSLAVWTTDGTWAGTTRVTNLPPGDGPSELVPLAGTLYFLSGRDDILYATDGTTAGTRSIARPSAETTSLWSPLLPLGGSLLLFTEAQRSNESLLWKFSGSAADSKIVMHFPGGSFIKRPYAAQIGTMLVFAWQESAAHANELWRTDGTDTGTSMVRDFGGTFPTMIEEIVSLGKLAVFPVDDGVHGREPWVTDGTPEGTRMLRDIHPTSSSNAHGFLVADGIAYFTASDPDHGAELWQTDGTPEGTQLVADIVPGAGSSAPTVLARTGNLLFFAATTPQSGYELWALPLAQPAVSIDDARARESAGRIAVPLHLSAPATSRVSVSYETADDTAKAGHDYTASSGTVTFNAGETTQSIAIPIADDAAPGLVRSFFVRIAKSDVPVARPTAAAIIEDDDVNADTSVSLTATGYLPMLNIANAGPSAASNVRLCDLLAPLPGMTLCYGPFELKPGETRSMQLSGSSTIYASVTQWERDPNPANNVAGWISNGFSSMSLFATPSLPRAGQSGTLLFGFYKPSADIEIALTSSDPSVISVPAKVTGAAGSDSTSSTFTALKPGTATITAKGPYSTATVTLRVIDASETRAATVVGLITPNQHYFGAFDITANVGGLTPDGAQPTGTITFSERGTAIATVPLVKQQATLTIPAATPGSHVYTAAYSGDARFLGAVSADVSMFVTKSTQVISAAFVSATDVAIVVHGVPGYPPTGTVTVKENRVTDRTVKGPLAPISNAASATTATGFTSTATSVLVTYSGDANYERTEQIVTVTPPHRRPAGH